MRRTIGVRLAVAVIAALSLCLSAAADVTLDDFEDGRKDNVYGEYWYTYENGYDPALGLGEFAVVDGAGSMAYAGINGAKKGSDDARMVVVGTNISEEGRSDWSGVTSITFRAKGPAGLKFRFYVSTTANNTASNWGKYGKLFKTASADWAEYTVNIPGDLTLDQYAPTFAFDKTKATKLEWVIKAADTVSTANASGVFAVDDIILKGSITPPAPPPVTKYALTYRVNDESRGCITAGSDCPFEWTDSVASGESGRTVTAKSASSLYRFVTWEEDGNTNATRTDVATGNKVFTAVFDPQKYTVTYKAGANGEIQVGGTLKQEHAILLAPGEDGPVVTAVGQMDPPYRFARWSDGQTTASRTDKVVNKDTTFTAEFEEYVAPPVIAYVKVAYTAGVGGSLVISDTRRPGPAVVTLVKAYADSLAPGDSVKATAVPDSNYSFYKWSDNVTAVERTDKYAGGDIRVDAIFLPVAPPNTVILAYSAGVGGKIKEGNGIPTTSIANNVVLESLGPVITAVPDAGYRFVKWDDGLTSVTRTDTAKANRMFTAEFAANAPENNTFTVSYIVGIGGKLSINNNYSKLVSGYDTIVPPGADAAVVTAVADSGYQFVKWSSGSTDNQRFNIDVRANVSDTAIFLPRGGDAVVASEREVPTALSAEVSAVVPVIVVAGEVTAGPNPTSAAVNFFRTGRAIKNGKLSVYDASGKLVTTISLSDKGTNGKRTVGSWNLKDGKGKPVANGSYAVKGTITTKDGVKEKVSTIIAVAK